MRQVFPIVAGFMLAFDSQFAVAGSLDRELGIVVAKENLVCLITSVTSLNIGSQVNLVLLSVPQKVVSGTVVSVSDRQCIEISKPHNVSGKYYRLSLLNNRSHLSVPTIGVLNSSQQLRRVGLKVVGDLDGDGIEESFRSCASFEGLHLTVWSGQALTGTRKWHSYYYLGFDSEPTCTKSEI
ncbi:hypothetical protein H6G17_22205 [Chroococcidiopsis sp. FACHB-1243]|uniref:hypothetical protein n=1 Tax=Chroococcidiopsis sp. [FACHB-1243] TaxID=2692781 RepID=UPI001781FF9E|nr:hypothetical protein [Chroococcidiopsis sp. [FACHB-1243]]MBD2308189.1 hypothetical protein [Chroococcidiopsis sp. [FACHB-1243]]